MIACCGLKCTECEAFIATQNDDAELRDKVAREWSHLYKIPVEPEHINCTGCLSDGVKTYYCGPIQLVGPEHYNAQLQYWTCSATPLLNERGRLMGVVNMAGHYRKVHKHTFGMVIALGRAIEYSWHQNSMRKEKELASRYIESIVDSISDGVLARKHR